MTTNNEQRYAALEKIMQKGFRERFLIGVEEGLSQGRELRLEHLKSLVLRLLRRKIGELSPESQEPISSLTCSYTIDDLAEALLSMQSADDLTAWLGANA